MSSILSNKSDIECHICTKKSITSGRTELLYLDNFCFIDKNDRSTLVVDKSPIFAEMRISLSILEHIAIPDKKVMKSAKNLLISYMKSELRLTDNDFITRIKPLKNIKIKKMFWAPGLPS